MTQVLTLKDLHDKRVTQSLGLFSSPTKTTLPISPLNLKKLHKALPQSFTDRPPTTTIKVKTIEHPTSSRQKMVIDTSLSPLKAPNSPVKSIEIVTSPRASKKIRIKPLLPKFSPRLPTLQTEESTQTPHPSQTRTLTEFPLQIRTERHLQSSNEYSASEVKSGTLGTLSSRLDFVDDFPQPQSARLPTITLKTSHGDSPASARVLYTDGGSTHTETKVTSPVHLRILKNNASEGSGLGAGKVVRNVSTPIGARAEKKKVESKPIGRMHFGVGKGTGLFDYAPSDQRYGSKSAFNKDNVNKIQIPTAQNFKRTDVHNEEGPTETYKSRPFVLKTDPEPEKFLVETMETSPAEEPILQVTEEDCSSQVSSKQLSLSNVYEEGEDEAPVDYVIPKPFSIEEAKGIATSLEELVQDTELEKLSSIAKSQAAEYTLPVLTPSPKKSVTFTEVSDVAVYLQTEYPSPTPIKSSLKKVISEGLKPAGLTLAPPKGSYGIGEDLNDISTGNISNNPVEEETHKFNIFKESNNVNFFEFNENNFLATYDKYSDANQIIRSQRRRTKTLPPVAFNPQESAAVIVSYTDERDALTIQPRFMENYGSMCFTELWSSRSKNKYKNIKKEELGLHRKVQGGSEDTLYRPGQARKKSIFESKIKANQQILSNPTLKNYETRLLSAAVSDRQSTNQEGMPKLRGVIDSPPTRKNSTLSILRPPSQMRVSLFSPTH